MPGNQLHLSVISFGPFEANLQTQELKKLGVRIRLPGQSFQILKMLLERPGDLISREELHQALWPADTFVDFEKGINAAINRLRDALGDSADDPRYVETLPRRGYRLIAPVTRATGSAIPLPAETLALPSATSNAPHYRLLLLGAIVAIMAALILWKSVFQTPNAPRVLRFTKLTTEDQSIAGPLCTDGSRIYFNEVLPGPRNRIVQVSVKGGEIVPIPVALKQPALLDLSKDGTEFLLRNHEVEDKDSLWIQSVAGGSPRRAGTVFIVDARFGADGKSIIYSTEHDVYSMNRDGTSIRKLLTIEGVPLEFIMGPKGDGFRFSEFDFKIDDVKIMEVATDGTGLHEISRGFRGNWTPDGRFFIFQQRPETRIDLWALPNKRRFHWFKPAGNATQLTAGPLSFQYPLSSKDGKRIIAVGESIRSEVTRYDSGSGQFVPFFLGISAEGLAFSNDGQWVTYTSFPDGTLWRSKLDGSERLQLTFLPLRVLLPRWSPDGKQIAFTAQSPGSDNFNLYLISSEGGAPQRILPSGESQVDPNWSPDGQSIVYGNVDFRDKVTFLYNINLTTKEVSTLPGSRGLFSPRLSPDGKYIAAMSIGIPGNLMLFDSSTKEWTAMGAQGSYMSWSHDGKFLYFKQQENSEQHIGERIARIRISDLKVETVAEVKNVGRLTTGTITDWLGLAPDDSPLLARDISSQEIYALEMQWP